MNCFEVSYKFQATSRIASGNCSLRWNILFALLLTVLSFSFFVEGVALGITGLVAKPAASILEVTGKTALSI